jgi:4-hydroxymandelate oxidase
MYAKDIAALEALALLPRVVHDAEEPDPGWFGLGVHLPGPLWAEAPSDWPGRVTSRPENALGSVWLAPPLRMKELMPMMRQAKELGALAAGIDFSRLVTDRNTRPRTASELSELKSAVGLPFIVAGVLDPRDAELACEAGADVILTTSNLSSFLGGPALATMIPDIRDAIGEVPLWARGGLRDGADVVRYLALGADAVVVPENLNPHKLLEDLAQVMRATGCHTLSEISYELIFEPTFD